MMPPIDSWRQSNNDYHQLPQIKLSTSMDQTYRKSMFDAEPSRQRSSMTSHADAPSFIVDEPFSLRHIWPLVIGVLFLCGTSTGIASIVKTYEIEPIYGNWTYEKFTEDSLVHEPCRAVDRPVRWKELNRKLKRCRRNEYYDPMYNDCQQCPATSPNSKVFAVFWETQSDCKRLVADSSNRYITHVMWSFAEPLEDGTVKKKLQFWDDDHIKDCMRQLRMRCIKQMIAIGGASFRERFVTLNNPANLARFKQSAIELVQYYDFDGIDIDDETANMKATGKNWTLNHAPTVLSYLQALREGMDAIQKPDEPRYQLSWDEFPFAWDKPEGEDIGCDNYDGDEGWHRCFEPRIAQWVDFVNIMFYNIFSFDDHLYIRMMKTTLPNTVLKTLPANKIVLGVCSGMGCVMDQPLGQDVYNAGNGSALYGGTMLWSATIDILYENSTALNRMGRSGNYGVKMPFRAPLN